MMAVERSEQQQQESKKAIVKELSSKLLPNPQFLVSFTKALSKLSRLQFPNFGFYSQTMKAVINENLTAISWNLGFVNIHSFLLFNEDNFPIELAHHNHFAHPMFGDGPIWNRKNQSQSWKLYNGRLASGEHPPWYTTGHSLPIISIVLVFFIICIFFLFWCSSSQHCPPIQLGWCGGCHGRACGWRVFVFVYVTRICTRETFGFEFVTTFCTFLLLLEIVTSCQVQLCVRGVPCLPTGFHQEKNCVDTCQV